MSDIIDDVYRVILDRKANPDETSYTASMMKKGLDHILKKFGEESAELIIAGKGGERSQIVYEAADVIFHLLVLFGYQEIDPEEIRGELRRRFGTSGLAEKASRKKD